MFEAADEAASVAGPLKGVQCLADLLDQRACAAEVDGVLTAVLAIAEDVVGAEGFSVAASVRGRDVTLTGEQVGAYGNVLQRPVGLGGGGVTATASVRGGAGRLVSKVRDFQFQAPWGLRFRCEAGALGKFEASAVADPTARPAQGVRRPVGVATPR